MGVWVQYIKAVLPRRQGTIKASLEKYHFPLPVLIFIMRLSFFAVGALISSAIASPTNNYAIHEKRDKLPRGWSKRDQLDKRAVMPMRIALAQRNLDRGYELLEEVSHPKSEKYGQHWSAKQVADMFSPRYISRITYDMSSRSLFKY